MKTVKQYSYWTTDAEMYQAVKAQAVARGFTLADAVTQALAVWLTSPPVAAPAKTRKVVAPSPAHLEPLCRRCAHFASMHWLRGCVAGCTCRKFVPPS